jgi:hypothetical protein
MAQLILTDSNQTLGGYIMTLEQLAMAGEFIGGFAVVITLIFLTWQIRLSNANQQREIYRAFISEFNRLLFIPMHDPETMALIQRADKDFDSLSLAEKGTMNAIWSPIMLLFNEVHATRAKSQLDHSMAHTLDVIILGFIQMPGFAMWFEHARPFFTDEFHAHIDKLLVNPERTPAINEMLPWYFPEEAASQN